jgi:hypothetical protein
MVCLAFDDGLPCHYKSVILELNRRGTNGDLLRLHFSESIFV